MILEINDLVKKENISLNKEVENIFIKNENEYYKAYKTNYDSITCEGCALFDNFGANCPAYCMNLDNNIDIKFKKVKSYEALFSSTTHAE